MNALLVMTMRKLKKALGLTDKDINNNPMLLEAWNNAKEEYYNKCIRM